MQVKAIPKSEKRRRGVNLRKNGMGVPVTLSAVSKKLPPDGYGWTYQYLTRGVNEIRG
jgi:hypothetical protein